MSFFHFKRARILMHLYVHNPTHTFFITCPLTHSSFPPLTTHEELFGSCYSPPKQINWGTRENFWIWKRDNCIKVLQEAIKRAQDRRYLSNKRLLKQVVWSCSSQQLMRVSVKEVKAKVFFSTLYKAAGFVIHVLAW